MRARRSFDGVAVGDSLPSETVELDRAALVAYTRQLPPAQGGTAEISLPMPLKAAYALGLLRDSAEKIDHSLPPGQPVVEGDQVTVATVMSMTLSVDHRVIDGALGAQLLQAIVTHLENPMGMLA